MNVRILDCISLWTRIMYSTLHINNLENSYFCKGGLESPRGFEWRWKEDDSAGYLWRGPAYSSFNACQPQIHGCLFWIIFLIKMITCSILHKTIFPGTVPTGLSENALRWQGGISIANRVQDINKVRGWGSVWLPSLLSGVPSRGIIQQKDEHLMAAVRGYTCAGMKEEHANLDF